MVKGVLKASAVEGVAETINCLGAASRRAARSITRVFDRELRAHGLRSQQFSILAVLSLAGPLAMGELASKLSLERTTLSRNLALIEQRGWIRVRPGDDARARIIEITAKGSQVIAAALPAWRVAQTSVAESLGEPGAAALHKIARRALP